AAAHRPARYPAKSYGTVRALCQQPAHEVERADDGAGPDAAAVAREAELPADAAFGPLGMEVDEADRLLGAAAVWAGYPGHRDRHVRGEAPACAARHRGCDLG